MTAPRLLAYILLVLLAQLAVALIVAAWRRRGAAEGLRPGRDISLLPAASDGWQGWREFRVARRAFEDTARTQCSFHLESVDGLPLPPFKPGQFLTLSLPLGERQAVTRCYSLSDRPHPGGYRLTIKRVPAPADRADLPPGVASNHLHDHIGEGAVIRCRAPAGHFFLDPDPALPVVLIAGGIGITPMMSMLLWCAREQPTRHITLYYGLRNGDEHAFRQPLAELAATHPARHLHVAYSRPRPEDVPGRDFQHAGHVDIDLLRRTLPYGRRQFYVCGPAAMMESLVPALRDWGVQAEDLHHEAFGPASLHAAEAEPTDATVTPVEVRFRRSGRTLAWDGRDASLLDFAERHGVEVEAGCRSGGCGSCETRLVSGTVRYAARPEHEVAPGHCLLCVGKPDSALVIEA